MKKNNFDNQNNNMEGTKKVPSTVLRKCCACGKIADRQIFIRILKNHKNGEYIINPTSKEFGRSIYICKSQECLKLAIKKKRLRNLNEDILNSLNHLLSLL